MIEALATTLLIFAQPVPAITCSHKDDKGNCVYNYSLKPEIQVHALHAEAITELYYPYFLCYYNHLSADERFGTAVGKIAIEAMHSARSSCAEMQAAADLEAGKYLSNLGIYGDAEHQRMVLERFRQNAGSFFVWTTARLNGRGDEFDRMAQAITNELIPSND